MNRPIDIIQVRHEIQAGKLAVECKDGNVLLTDKQSGEAVCIAALTPQNESLTLEQIKSLYDSPAWYQDLYRKMGYWVIVGAIGEIGVHLTDLDNANEFYSTIDYGARWALFRRPPERQEDA